MSGKVFSTSKQVRKHPKLTNFRPVF